MAEELTVAEIQQSFFDYRAFFKEPVTSAWFGKQGDAAKLILKVLAPWNVTLENVTWNREIKNFGETLLTFAVPSLSTNINLGMGAIGINAVNPYWDNAKALLSLFQTAVTGIKASISAEIQTQQAAIAFHVKPGVHPFGKIMGQYVDTKILDADDALMMGISVYKNDYSFVIDNSALFSEFAFVRLTRIFPASTSFEEMAATLYKDEDRILKLLGMKIQ